MGYAYQLLGAALHPLQDKYAHTDKVTKFRTIIISVNGQLMVYRFYEHKVYDLLHISNQADDAKAHWSVVNGVVKKYTKYYLKTIFDQYKTLIKNCSPAENYSYFFPNSYKSVKPFVL